MTERRTAEWWRNQYPGWPSMGRERMEMLFSDLAAAEAERDALAAAMPSEGADAALAYAVEKSRANKAERERDEARATKDMHKERQENEIELRLKAEAEVKALREERDELSAELADMKESLIQANIQNTRIECKNEDLTRTVDDLMQERHDAEEGGREVNSAGGERKHTMRFEDRMMFWDGDDNDADLMCSNLLGWIEGLAEVVNHNADLLGCHLAAIARIEARRGGRI
jgi:hypothetical protein